MEVIILALCTCVYVIAVVGWHLAEHWKKTEPGSAFLPHDPEWPSRFPRHTTPDFVATAWFPQEKVVIQCWWLYYIVLWRSINFPIKGGPIQTVLKAVHTLLLSRDLWDWVWDQQLCEGSSFSSLLSVFSILFILLMWSFYACAVQSHIFAFGQAVEGWSMLIQGQSSLQTIPRTSQPMWSVPGRSLPMREATWRWASTVISRFQTALGPARAAMSRYQHGAAETCSNHVFIQEKKYRLQFLYDGHTGWLIQH